MKPKLVQFSDGKFGVMRRRFWRDEFLAFTGSGNWYRTAADVHALCKGTRAEAVRFFPTKEYVLVADGAAE